MGALKIVGASVPIAAISLNALGERIIFVTAVLAAIAYIWHKLIEPVIEAVHGIIVGVRILRTINERVEVIEDKLEALEYVGKIVDVAADEHVRAARDALIRSDPDRPQ